MTTQDLTQNVATQRVAKSNTISEARRAWLHAQDFPKREELTFPLPPRYNRKSFTDKHGRQHAEDTFGYRLHVYLCKRAMQLLNSARHRAVERDENTHTVTGGQWVTLDAEILAQALWDDVLTTAPHRVVIDEDGQGMKGAHAVTWSHLDDETDRVAALAVESWDPRYLARLSALGRKGGQKSKPPVKHSLEAFQALPKGLTVKQQAEAMKCNERTIYRLRAEAKKVAELKAAETVEPDTTDPIVTATMDSLEWDLYSYIDLMEEENRTQAVTALRSLVEDMDLT